MFLRPIHRHALLCAMLGALATAAQATPIPAGINVGTSASLDTINSTAASNASQSGQIGLINNGIAISSPFNNLSIASNPLNGNASQTGDGASLGFALSGTALTTSALSDGLFGDLYLNFSNNSATAYKIRFAVDMLYGNLQASGDNAFVKFDFSLQDAGANEIFFSSRLRDTLNGNADGDSASNLIEILLNPGDSTSFHGIEKASAGAFSELANYSGDVSATLRLVDFTPHIPLPSTLLLAGLGLGLMAGKRRFF